MHPHNNNPYVDPRQHPNAYQGSPQRVPTGAVQHNQAAANRRRQRSYAGNEYFPDAGWVQEPQPQQQQPLVNSGYAPQDVAMTSPALYGRGGRVGAGWPYTRQVQPSVEYGGNGEVAVAPFIQTYGGYPRQRQTQPQSGDPYSVGAASMMHQNVALPRHQNGAHPFQAALESVPSQDQPYNSTNYDQYIQQQQQLPPSQTAMIYAPQPPPHHHSGPSNGMGQAMYPPSSSFSKHTKESHSMRGMNGYSHDQAAPFVNSSSSSGIDVEMMYAGSLVAPSGQVQNSRSRPQIERPLIRLSVSLIETYRDINYAYYANKSKRRAERQRAAAAADQQTSLQQKQLHQQRVVPASTTDDSQLQQHQNSVACAEVVPEHSDQQQNHTQWDDENYDYVIHQGELFYNRYLIKERIGRGSFGQVIRATDTLTKRDVAIKIIKSRKPFRIQAQTEIELLTSIREQDPEDGHNIVRLEEHFMFRNHQCLVFELLSLNLYELLRNTQFNGVSLNLIRKFGKQTLKALLFLSRPDVNIIHCDLKPENILLRHPKRSTIKVVDFGSSCRSNRQTYSYIQSRFYRSPEVMLGLPYSVAIDMWSLGCILVEMHTGEPLFSGQDQFDQMQKITEVLGEIPPYMIERSSAKYRDLFFERRLATVPHECPSVSPWALRTIPEYRTVVPSTNPRASLTQRIRADTNRRANNTANNHRMKPDLNKAYAAFEDLIYRMLAYDPQDRIQPMDALRHPFITEIDAQARPSNSNSNAAPVSMRGNMPTTTTSTGSNMR